MKSFLSLQLSAIFGTVSKLFLGGKKNKNKPTNWHLHLFFFPVLYTVTVLSTSLLCQIILNFLA